MSERYSPANPAVAMIWAMTRNGVIGRAGGLPWRLPEDLQFFMRTTTAKPNIMGRKTLESMKAPLPRRTNIVVTRQPDYRRDRVQVTPTLDSALELARAQCLADGRDELMVIGGAELYRTALPQADRLYVTRVDAELEGDTVFPAVDWDRFEERWRQGFGQLPAHDYPFSIAMYEVRS